MNVRVSTPSLVLLIGASSAGKSTFARAHFRPTEVLSSDTFRAMVADDENDQTASGDAFDALRVVARKRIAAGRLTVVDATSVRRDARRPFLTLAREHDLPCVAVVLDLPAEVCAARHRARGDRPFGDDIVRLHVQQLRSSLPSLRDEGFADVTVLETPEAVAAATVQRVRLPVDRRDDTGPFDIVGDVHGCCDELLALLAKLGYSVLRDASYPHGFRVSHAGRRRLVFLGDLVDRGPRVVDALRLVMSAVSTGAAFCLPGNHESKLVKALSGRDVRVAHGLGASLAQLEEAPESFSREVVAFVQGLPSHLVLDGGKLVVAHAGLKQAFHGRESKRVESFALFGDTTGRNDDYGLPIRRDWASEYRGAATVVYGHTPVADAEWVHGTLNVDTGCVFGGRLSALRYPEREVVSVPAAREYDPPIRPFARAAT